MEDIELTITQKNQITELRNQGFGYATIANAVGVKKDTVVAFCRKNGLTGTKAENKRITVSSDICLCCGTPIQQKPGQKRRKFCSSSCRVKWWNSHPEKVNRKALYKFICAFCGIEFTAYGNANRKYCSHECYVTDRFGGDERA